MKHVFEILDSFFETKENRVSKLKLLISEHQRLKKKKEKKIEEISFQTNSRDGIISFLTKRFS
jgi:sporulation protein YlmC with PRC-barrel domain